MAKRFSAQEKEKAIAGTAGAPSRFRIRAPDFDPSELIRENTLTLVGRLTNPKEQSMSSVISYLANKWNMEPTAGSDLGRDCFQFRFSKEADLCEVLKNRPYQFGRWMVIVQRWEPIISPSFPSQIPFWITIRGLPLHYWHEKVVRDIGLELGGLEDYEVTKTTARFRLVVDGLKPLIMETDMAYASGEESILTLEYERLGNHCTSCHRLSHLQSQCPERPNRLPPPPSATYIAQPSYKEDISEGPPPPRPTKEFEARENRPFQQRLDRHGRPFGNRISSTMVRPLGPKNKIAPASSAAQYLEEKEQRYRFEVQREHHYNSPPYTRRGTNILENQEEQTPTRTSNRQQTTLRWRVKSPPANQEATSPAIPVQSTRSSLGRNLDAVDFSPLYDGSNRETILEDLREASLRYINCDDPSERAARQQRVLQSELNGTVEATAAHLMQTPTRNTYGQRTSADLPPIPEIPTTEEVMEELRDATTQYLSCADPVERAARKQRVLQSELDGTVEATAANIILSSALTARTLRTADSSVIILPDTQLSTMQEPEPMAPQVTTTRKRGRPAKAKQPVPQNPSSSTAATKPTTSRSTVKLSPRTFAGMGSKKRMLARVQASPGTSNRHPPRRITQGPPATTSSTAPAIAIIPPVLKQRMDFHPQRPDLP
ncbi:uncharacterized protein LOC130498971 [Raphanus sativus]|uniref:Uncharacterized protein LOC130498971 n=1 Tax=Raphanus sativus TaxID=3726 RepID=A0A9W3CBB9_RAPSA|nr:uncharacterized protein LOC130498971 [Raphanus sativus]